jgi:hypothetical protein
MVITGASADAHGVMTVELLAAIDEIFNAGRATGGLRAEVTAETSLPAGQTHHLTAVSQPNRPCHE